MDKLKSLFVALGISVYTNAVAHYHESPYSYCSNNPINCVDPDGRDVLITGPLANMALEQIQSRVGENITLSLNENNYMCYSISGNGNLNEDAKRVIGMVDNCDIVVNMETRDDKMTSTNNLFLGGAFMGNNVEFNEKGTVLNVTANQEVNPNVLGKADEYSPKGTFIMHELTEAYEGAIISADNKKSSPNSNGNESVYKKAHEKATYQPLVYQRLIDANGNITRDVNNAQRVEWFVKPNKFSTKEKIIQTYP